MPRPSPSVVHGARWSAHCAMCRADSLGSAAQALPRPPRDASAHSTRPRHSASGCLGPARQKVR
eukprot:6576305-Pyramimonas_sp.AAC.1